MGIGRRVLELGCLREKSSKRETRMLGILQFITGTVWKLLFGAAADSLEKSVEEEDEFMIVERSPLVSHYISNAPCNCCAFVAGIVRGGCIPPLYLPYISPISHLYLPYIASRASCEARWTTPRTRTRTRTLTRTRTQPGVLEDAGFPAQVSAHDREDAGTVILIKFGPEVLEREKRQEART